MTAEQTWPAPTVAGPVVATVRLPGSKSLTNRYLVLAALAEEPSRLRGPLRSRDTLLMAEALSTLGVGVEDDVEGEDWLVLPGPMAGDVEIDCGLAGTVMRFLPPVAALAARPVTFDGDDQARVRPMAPILAGLRGLGVGIDDGGRGTLPFTVLGTGSVPGGEVGIDASSSSQFGSGLLLAGARFRDGVTVVNTGGPVPSEPHIAMTVKCLRDRGVTVDDDEPGRWRVAPGPIAGADVTVEPDLSNAGPFLAAAAVTGGRVTVPDWPQRTTQAGDLMRDLLDEMGAQVTLDRDGLTVAGEELFGIDADLRDGGELAPTIAALAALADSPTQLRGIAHLRGHETDRLAALATELNALGGDVRETQDGLVIRPKPLHGGVFHTYHDHRMATAGAILGLRVPGILVENVETTTKTLPGFVDLWTGMLGLGADA